MSPGPKYKRVLLKLSGESLLGEGDRRGINPQALSCLALEVARAASRKIQLAIVIGGGNIWRGAQDRGEAIERVTADNMGMLATIINALALQDALKHLKLLTRVQTSIEIMRLAEPFIRLRAIRHLEKGRIVIFAGGTGNPYFSTDTAAALRASEIEADVLMKATKVDGVYTDDPKRNRAAKLLSELTYMEAIQKRLRIMDSSALTLCMDNNLPIRVFNWGVRGNIARAVEGQKVGTIIHG